MAPVGSVRTSRSRPSSGATGSTSDPAIDSPISGDSASVTPANCSESAASPVSLAIDATGPARALAVLAAVSGVLRARSARIGADAPRNGLARSGCDFKIY